MVREYGFRSWTSYAAHEVIAPGAYRHNMLQPRRCPSPDPQRVPRISLTSLEGMEALADPLRYVQSFRVTENS
jgi:hypothetical protein